MLALGYQACVESGAWVYGEFHWALPLQSLDVHCKFNETSHASLHTLCLTKLVDRAIEVRSRLRCQPRVSPSCSLAERNMNLSMACLCFAAHRHEFISAPFTLESRLSRLDDIFVVILDQSINDYAARRFSAGCWKLQQGHL